MLFVAPTVELGKKLNMSNCQTVKYQLCVGMNAVWILMFQEFGFFLTECKEEVKKNDEENDA
tara:strand:- start:365 stop:550 length:186 start_codon:yes stop_codon:yes gene_type:complete